MTIDAVTLDALTRALRERRATVLREATGAKADLLAVAETRDSELEERAQEERTAHLLARLDERSRAELAAIDAALDRMADGVYGTCSDCGEGIPVERLAAVPAAERCVRCAWTSEHRPPSDGE